MERVVLNDSVYCRLTYDEKSRIIKYNDFPLCYWLFLDDVIKDFLKGHSGIADDFTLWRVSMKEYPRVIRITPSYITDEKKTMYSVFGKDNFNTLIAELIKLRESIRQSN